MVYRAMDWLFLESFSLPIRLKRDPLYGSGEGH